MKPFFKSQAVLAVVSTLLCAGSLQNVSYAGGKTHGVDLRALEYTAYAQLLKNHLEDERLRHFWFFGPKLPMTPEQLEYAIETTTVRSADAICVVDSDEKEVCSTPDEKLTEMNKLEWDKITDPSLKMGIVCHEYAIQLGIERNNYYNKCNKIVASLWKKIPAHELDDELQQIIAAQKKIQEEVQALDEQREQALQKERAEIERLENDKRRLEEKLLLNLQEQERLINDMKSMELGKIE